MAGPGGAKHYEVQPSLFNARIGAPKPTRLFIHHLRDLCLHVIDLPLYSRSGIRIRLRGRQLLVQFFKFREQVVYLLIHRHPLWRVRDEGERAVGPEPDSSSQTSEVQPLYQARDVSAPVHTLAARTSDRRTMTSKASSHPAHHASSGPAGEIVPQSS